MSAVLTITSAISCGHGGTIAKPAESKLSVGGQWVLTQSDVDAKAVLPTCSQANTNKGEVPCSVFTVEKGAAGKLTVGKSPVLLDTLAGSTGGKPDSSLKLVVDRTQTKLTAS